MEKPREETTCVTCIGRILFAELIKHGPLFNGNDQMPEKVKCHNPEKTDPVIEEDR